MTVYDFTVRDSEGELLARYEPTADIKDVRAAVAARES